MIDVVTRLWNFVNSLLKLVLTLKWRMPTGQFCSQCYSHVPHTCETKPPPRHHPIFVSFRTSPSLPHSPGSEQHGSQWSLFVWSAVNFLGPRAASCSLFNPLSVVFNLSLFFPYLFKIVSETSVISHQGLAGDLKVMTSAIHWMEYLITSKLPKDYVKRYNTGKEMVFT